MIGLWIKLLPGFMKINFLVSEFQCNSPFPKKDRFHTQHRFIKYLSFLYVSNSEDKMIEFRYFHDSNSHITPYLTGRMEWCLLCTIVERSEITGQNKHRGRLPKFKNLGMQLKLPLISPFFKLRQITI